MIIKLEYKSLCKCYMLEKYINNQKIIKTKLCGKDYTYQCGI
jgi:hypothetical protein